MAIVLLTPGEQGEEWFRNVKRAIDELYARQVGITIAEGGTPVDAEIATLNFNASHFNISETAEGIVLVELATPFTGITVESADVTVDGTVTTFDFGTFFIVTESPEDEVNIGLDTGFTSTELLTGDYWEINRSAYNSATKTNSDTGTYSTTNMPSITITMPVAGTIDAVSLCRAGHDADGSIDHRITIDGNSSTSVPRSAPSVGGHPFNTRHTRAVSAGSRTIQAGFKPNTAGQATISDAVLMVTAHAT